MVKLLKLLIYLVLMVTPKLVWTRACKTLSEQVSNALSPVKSLIRSYELSTEEAFNVFYKKIVPILTYGAEIWGFEKRESIEIVHRKFCKYLLHTGYRTANAVAFGECGRVPLHTIYHIECIITGSKYYKCTQVGIHYNVLKCYCHGRQKTP